MSKADHFLELMNDADRDEADAIKNKVLDLLGAQKTTRLIALSAVRCVASGLEELIKEQTGGDIVTVESASIPSEALDKLRSRLINLSAAMVQGTNFLSDCADDYNWSRIGTGNIVSAAQAQREQLRCWAMELREIYDALPTAYGPAQH